MTRRLTIAVFVLIFSLSGCVSAGKWTGGVSLGPNGLTITNHCEDGYGESDECWLSPDIDVLEWWSRLKHMAEGGPPDGREIPMPARPPTVNDAVGPPAGP